MIRTNYDMPENCSNCMKLLHCEKWKLKNLRQQYCNDYIGVYELC